MMFKRSTWLHLRIPFSFFLLPVFLFALALSPNINGARLLIVFMALHIFLYPASNGFNSYFDKDEKSIGGLKHPPKVSVGLYYTALLFDLAAILTGLLINWQFALMLLLYGLVSKAYSHPVIRLKKYAYASWFIAGLFQGAFTFLMAYTGLNGYGFGPVFRMELLLPALLTSFVLWGSYPMTQIYQHEEDHARGDLTLSYKLGIKGTFYFTAVVFTVAVVLFCLYFSLHHKVQYAWSFVVLMAPTMIYFLYWFFRVLKNQDNADYGHTMWLNFISSFFLNTFFIHFFLDRTHILQAL